VVTILVPATRAPTPRHADGGEAYARAEMRGTQF
jgi:hypothetical protein